MGQLPQPQQIAAPSCDLKFLSKKYRYFHGSMNIILLYLMDRDYFMAFCIATEGSDQKPSSASQGAMKGGSKLF